MSEKPRSAVFDPDVVGVYHCWNRVVQRRNLFGWDALTKTDFSYRKGWVLDRLKQMASVMAVDVLDYAILGNHLHSVLRNRPDIVEQWNDNEVANRWWYVCPGRKNDDGSAAEPTPFEIRMLEQDADEYRKRLSDISWFMRLLCQPIARRANREDEMDGRFFAKRFDCKRLESIADVLACSLYVDLNAIHAGLATTPEESAFTSAFDRIRAKWQTAQSDLNVEPCNSLNDNAHADEWLAPVFLDERAEMYHSPEDASASNPIGAPRISNKGFLPISCEQYISLLDTIGRIIRCDKSGHIPSSLPPIMERLSIGVEDLVTGVVDLFNGSSALQTTPIISPG